VECAYDTEDKKENVERLFGQQNVAKEKLSIIQTFQ